MSVINIPLVSNLGFIPLPLRTVVVSATRDGQQTAGYKEAVLWDSIYSRKPLLYFPIRDGKSRSEIVVASAIDGLKAIMLYDFDAQPYAVVRTPIITADLELNLDLNDGTGGGAGPAGDPATAEAVVRVNKLPATREIVAIEKTSNGTWRMAGNQSLQTGLLEIQVTGGQVFAVGMDDYGTLYQPGSAVEVGHTIRPTVFAGWLYRCTEAGELAATEPEWWVAEGENPAHTVGTARLQAVRYYQPVAHGPINYELI